MTSDTSLVQKTGSEPAAPMTAATSAMHGAGRGESTVLCFWQFFYQHNIGVPMNQNLQQSYAGSDLLVVRHRVLRNTYWLLALSMIPTVLGAWLGVQFNFSFFAGSPLIGFMLFMAIAVGFFYAIEKTKNSALGVAFL